MFSGGGIGCAVPDRLKEGMMACTIVVFGVGVAVGFIGAIWAGGDWE